MSLEVSCADDVVEREIDWLVPGFISRGSITTLAGAGGSGKTFAWCAIAAAISSGRKPFLLGLPDDWYKAEPGTVLFFSAEDPVETVLRKRLRENGTDLKNIHFIDIEDTERFSHIKFSDDYLRQIIEKYQPTFCIFDPIQAFIPSGLNMASRNDMRSCMDVLIGYGKRYKTTFLIVCHANKRGNVSGRYRMADSSDIWDISRAVIMAGETTEPGKRYLSNEKSNYGDGLTGSVIYQVKDGKVLYVSDSDKRDEDFIAENAFSSRIAPQKDDAKEFILEYLSDGEKPVKELDEAAKAMGTSGGTLKRAKSELKSQNKICYRQESIGQGTGVMWYISLT